MTAIVFGKDGCPSCKGAKELLLKRNIRFIYIECKVKNPHVLQEVQDKIQHKTWPKIVLNDDWNHFYGFDTLKDKLDM